MKRPLKISLVFPPFEDRRPRGAYYVAPPLGLLRIAAYLERDGHAVAVHDFILALRANALERNADIYRTCAERILADDPDVVGISTQCTTTPAAVNIARLVKKLRPSVLTLLGGHDVSFLAERYLQAFPFVDLVLAGEAELTMAKLARAVAGESSYAAVPGLTYRAPDGAVRTVPGSEVVTNLDSLLPPSYPLVGGYAEYFRHSKVPTVLVESGRGCSYACRFCQATRLTGGRVRYRSAASILGELRAHLERFPTFDAYFVHDLFTARRSFVEELCERLIDAKLGLRWHCRCRIDQVDPPLLALMRGAGCTMLLYGVESGSDDTLRQMGKRFRPGPATNPVEPAQWTVDAGIFPSLSMVVGTPEETLADVEQTLRLAAELSRTGRVNAFIQQLCPLPGTQMATSPLVRTVYRPDSFPTAFAQGIEFVGGRRLPEDERLIVDHPDIFVSFRKVVPAHGDLLLCERVSQAYCKLLEVYLDAFVELAGYLHLSHSELFTRFCDFVKTSAGDAQRPDDAPLFTDDAGIWDGFGRFAAAALAGRRPTERLETALAFGRIVHEIAVAEPVPDPPDVPAEVRAGEVAFVLRPAARLFRSRLGLPAERRLEAGEERSYLLYMTADRLSSVDLPPPLAEAIETLPAVAEAAGGECALSGRLARILDPVMRLGVFQPAAPHRAPGHAAEAE